MAVPFTIKITKEILLICKYCGAHDDIENIGENCAIAVTVKDIFPEVMVTGHHIYPFGYFEDTNLKIRLPQVAQNFIKVFDSLAGIPNTRLCLPEFEFEISIPDEVIERVEIGEALDIFEGGKCDTNIKNISASSSLNA